MKNKRMLGSVALVLCTVLLLTACFNPLDLYRSALSRLLGGASERRVVPFSQMQYQRPDVPAMEQRLEQIVDEMYAAESFTGMLQSMMEANEILEEFMTMRTLAELHWYLDVNNSYYEEETRYCNDAGVEMSILGTDLNRALVEGPFADEYREQAGEYYYESVVNSLLLSSPEVEQYKKEREALNTDYHQKLSNLPPVEYEGNKYTLDDILALGEPALREELYIEYYSQNAEEFTDLYREMIDLDKQTAQTLGFSSATEMYYLSYNRDYTPQDALAFCENSKQIFVPMVKSVTALQIPGVSASMSRTFSQMPSSLEKIDPELAEVWNSMVQYGLSDYGAQEGKQSDGAFTTYIYGYDAPFCYGYWDGSFRSATTVIHEFGHFYDFWIHYNTASAQNLDVVEVYSQGLELLMHDNFGDFTSEAEAAVLANLTEFFDVMLYQALLEEFQQAVYEMEDFEAEDIAALYAEMYADYGYGDYSFADESGNDYSWYRVPHLFDAPFYTISYCTSASVALQIWAQAQEDWQAGVDTYMAMIHADQNQPFLQLVESVGLRDPQDEEVLREIAGYFAAEFAQYGGGMAMAA